MTARRTNETPVRIYKYGCVLLDGDQRARSDSAPAQLIETELRNANDYYNELIEIERRRKAAFGAERANEIPWLAEVEKRLAEIESELDVQYEAKRGGDDLAAGRIEKMKGERLALWDDQKRGALEFEELIAREREAYAARTSGAPDALNEQIAELGRQIREAKKIRRNPAVGQLKRSLGDLKKERRKCGEATHKRAAVNARVLAEMLAEPEWAASWKVCARADAQAVAEVKLARSKKLVSSGTSLLVEKALEAAKREPGDLGFSRFEPEGRVGGQCAGGLSREDMHAGKSSLVRVTVGERMNRRARKAVAELGLGTDEQGKRRAVRLSLSWHRDLPSDARITWAWLLVRKCGTQTIYELQLTLEAADLPARKGLAASGCAEVGLGWAWVMSSDGKSKIGLRVASYVGDDGASGECMLWREPPPPEPDARPPGKRLRRGRRGIVDRLNLREATLRRIADAHFNAVRRLFARAMTSWGRQHPERIPGWLTERPPPVRGKERGSLVDTMSFWRRHEPLLRIADRWSLELLGEERIRALWTAWRDERKGSRRDLFEDHVVTFVRWSARQGVTTPDAQLALLLAWWARKDRHLTDYGARVTQRARRARRQYYRNWAIKLAESYQRIVIFDLDLRRTAKERGPKDTAPNPMDSTLRSQQRDAAPSDMRHALLEVFGSRATVKKRERPGGDKPPGGARKSADAGKDEGKGSERPNAAE